MKYLVATIICVGCIVHNFYFYPYLVYLIYNWYLQAFFNTEPMNWHIAFGCLSFIGILLCNLKKNEPSEKKEEWKVTKFCLGYTGGIWVTYFVAWFCKDLNLI